MPPPQKRGNGPLLAILAVLLIAAVGGGLWWKSQHPDNAVSKPPTSPATPPEALPAKPSPAPAPATPESAAAPTSTETPAATAAPVVEERDITIDANVEGAEIRVDGKTKPGWVTPHRVHLRDGSHQVEVAKDGYKPASKALKLTADSPKSMSFTLAALSSDVEITSNPPGATVVIDGTEQSAQTPSKYALAFGEHSLEVRKKGFRPETRTLKVDQSTFGVAVQLRRADVKGPIPSGVAQGRVRVLTRPPGSKIMVDGKGTDYESPVNFTLPVGSHTITVRHRGLQPVSRDIEVKAGQQTDVEINLLEVGRGRR